MAVDDTARASERTPLIASTTGPKTLVDEHHELHGAPLLTPARKTAILLILSAFILALGIGDELISPAQTRVIEAIVCRHFYDSHDPSIIRPGHDNWWDDESHRGVLLGVQEKWCKVPQVQGEVAMLKGWQTALESIGSLVLAVPFGWFADAYGRRPLLIMLGFSFGLRAAWQQFVLYNWQLFNVKMIWLSAFYSVLGGGTTVAGAVCYTAVSDIALDVDRTSQFFRITAASLAASLISPPISAWLMQSNPWLAMLIGLAFMLVPVPFLGMMPETLHYRTRHAESSKPASPIAPVDGTLSSWRRAFKATTAVVQHSVGFLAKDLRVGFLVFSFMLHTLLLWGSRDIFLQYASTRYDISLSKSTLVLSIRAGFNLFMMLLLLPALSNWLNRRPAFQAHPSITDLLLARGSAVLMALGFFLIAVASGLPLYIVGLVLNTAGWGLMTYVRSIALSFVDKHAIARLFAVMSLMDTVGLMVGAPALAELFEIGVGKGFGWMGLPFLACAAFMVVVSIGLATMRAGALIESCSEDEEDGEEALQAAFQGE